MRARAHAQHAHERAGTRIIHAHMRTYTRIMHAHMRAGTQAFKVLKLVIGRKINDLAITVYAAVRYTRRCWVPARTLANPIAR